MVVLDGFVTDCFEILRWTPPWKLPKKAETCRRFGTCLSLYLIVPFVYVCDKVKRSRYRPGVAQRLGRGIAILFYDRGTRRGWVVSSTPRPYFTPGKDPLPIVQEAGWTPEPVWKVGKSRPHRDSIADRSARSQSIYRVSCPAHIFICVCVCVYIYIW